MGQADSGQAGPDVGIDGNFDEIRPDPLEVFDISPPDIGSVSRMGIDTKRIEAEFEHLYDLEMAVLAPAHGYDTVVV